MKKMESHLAVEAINSAHTRSESFIIDKELFLKAYLERKYKFSWSYAMLGDDGPFRNHRKPHKHCSVKLGKLPFELLVIGLQETLKTA